ncbi:hypothetical protein ACI782_20850 [Geodermatophilus sp. SYSU D00703]
MSRPSRPLDDAPAAARSALPGAEAAAFDRLAHAVLAKPGAALGAVLRAQLPGTEGVRWLHSGGLPPTARAADLTAEQWLSLYHCWASTGAVRATGAPGGRTGRPSTHGHAPGALAIPRWGS